MQSITAPSRNLIRYTYDAASRIDSLVVGPASGGNSIWETHVYDADGRQLRRIRATSSRGLFDESFWYDAQGRPLKVGRSTAANGAPTDTSNFVYSGLGAVQARERIDQLAQWESEEFRNDAFGNVFQSRAGVSNNGGVQDPRYARYLFRGQLSARNTLQPQRESETFSQLYDADGNVSQRFLLTRLVFGDYTADDQVRNYYDAANRLRAVQHYNTVNSSGVERGTFDEYEYDALGRRIVVLAHRNAMVPACVGITYCITNLCNTTSCASSQTRFAWDGQALLIEDRQGLDGGGLSSDNGSVTYVNGLELDRPVGVLDSRVSGGLRVPHPNWRGMYESSSSANGAAADCSLTSSPCTPVAWNATGAIYRRPAPTDVSYTITYTWVGSALMDQQDATGLLYRRNRYYDPTSGRFTQEDPIGLAGGLNLYGFASGDPVNFSDPFGLCVTVLTCWLHRTASEVGASIVAAGRSFGAGFNCGYANACEGGSGGQKDGASYKLGKLFGVLADVNSIEPPLGPAEPFKASDVSEWAESQGWTKTQTPGGPLQYVDENGVARVTLKQGSARVPGSENPHMELRNASGERIDVYGKAVSKKNPANHHPLIWDIK